MAKSRIFLWVMVSFIAGVAVRSYADIGYLFIALVIMIGALLCAAGALRGSRTMCVFGLFAFAAALGVYRFDAAIRSRPDLSAWYGQNVVLTGVVREDPERTEKVQRLTVRVSDVNHAPPERRFFVLATLPYYPEYRIGDELELTGMLERPENYSNEFDYVSYLAKDRIFAAMGFPDVTKISARNGSAIRLVLSDIKHAFEERLERVLPDPHAAFLKGLLLGGSEALPPELIEDFRRTGTSHIVALSGYNITLVSRFFMQVLLWLTVWFYAAFWIAAAAIVLFVVLVGASASVVRAGILGVLVLVAEREGRLYSIRNALALAAAIMIWVNPLVLRFDAAFQISFLATLGLVYGSGPVERAVDRVSTEIRRAFGNRVAAAFRKSPYRTSFISARVIEGKRVLVETLAAQLAVLPLLIVLFGSISLVSPVANVLVLLAVPYAMAAGFMTGAVGFLSEAVARIPALTSWALLEYQLRVIGFFAAMRFASLPIGAWAGAVLAVAYAMWVCRALFRRVQRAASAVALVPDKEDRSDREEKDE